MSFTQGVLKTGAILATVLGVAVSGGGASHALAQQTPPVARVFGSITFNGQNGPSGAVVTAFAGTTLCGTASGSGLYNGTRYFVDIDSSITACKNAGASISFKVNGQFANECFTVTDLPGSAAQVNLTGPAANPSCAATSAATATYQAGWNIVGGPSGTVFSQASGSLFTFQAGDTNYETIPNTQPAKAGVGYWAFFTSTTTVTLSGTTALPFSVSVPAGQFIMIANPSATNTVTVSGADVVDIFDPVANAYSVSTTLKPGQGAWVFSNTGATVTMQ